MSGVSFAISGAMIIGVGTLIVTSLIVFSCWTVGLIF